MEPQDTITRTAVADAVVTRELEGKDEEVEMLRVPISSTRADRENDEFSKEALEGMADQIKRDQPMVFDNHGLAGNWMDAIPYDSRETIGAQMDAEVVEDGDDADLYAFVNPDGTHPEGERMLKQVRDEGQPIKFSVGFKVQNADEKTDDAGNEIGRIFTSADLMETSRVGIPANPDASVTQSVTASKDAGGLPGFQNHPILRMLQLSNTPEQGESVAKGVTPEESGEKDADEGPDPIAELTEEVRELRNELDTLKSESKEDDEDDDGECSVDTDCPEGEVCLEGECVPEDDVDDEESSADDSEIEALRAEIAELRESGLTRGQSSTSDTDMETRETPEDDVETASDDDGTHETKDDEGAEPSPNDWLNTN